ncbi:MAG TPA: MarR family transcriptional regulator [Magnetospirillaceae bacterium]
MPKANKAPEDSSKTPGLALKAKSPGRIKPLREIERGILENFIGFNLRQAQDAAYRAFVHHSQQKDFKVGWFAALMLLRYNPGLSQMDLSREMARDKSTITPLIQELEKRGLVARKPSPNDRRSVVLTLTKAGEKYLDALLIDSRAHDKRLDAIVGADKPRLLRLLKKIAAENG